MKIRVLHESDASSFQQLRLRALKLNPEAYGSTYEQELAFSLETILVRIQSTASKFVLGAFDEENSLVGMTRFVREDGPKTSHKASIYGVFVAPEVRGSGIARSLMLEIIDRSRDYAGLEQLHLSVITGNDPAKNLYTSLGFQAYGIEPNALKFEGNYYHEEFMVLKL